MPTGRITVCVVALIAATLSNSSSLRSSASNDPYEPLKLYDGKWQATVTTGGSDTLYFDNHCARTGLFFVCEQSVNGKSAALVVFLPVATLPSGAQEYKNMSLPADGGAPDGSWSKVTIDGDTWIYSWEGDDAGKKVFWRNVNKFSGPNKIHFEIQNSEDAITWKISKAGDEIRLPK